jgi:PAS domain S-box-containing protein
MTSTAAASGSQPVNILLVDDHRENLVSLEAILKRADYRLFAAQSGKEALQLALRERFDVVLLDVVMPEMDGFEVAHYLKQTERTSKIPILFLTALATDIRHIYHAYEVGAVDYLIKPLDAEVVRKKVAVFVELARQRDEIAAQAERLRETQRREYELQLAELRIASDRRYHKLVEGIDHVIGWTVDETLRLTFVSRQAEQILGYRTDAFLDPDFWKKHLHPDDRDQVLAIFHTLLAAEGEQGDVISGHRLLAADGRAVWLHTGISRATDDNNRPEIHGVSVDITTIKRAEEADALLADAGSILATSHDHRAALQDLATRVVAQLGDWCVIDERFETTGLVEVAVAHFNPELETWVRSLARRRFVNATSPIGAGAVIRSGTGQLHRRIPDEGWLADALESPQLDVVRALGGYACMFVPLAARGRTIGVMTIVASRPERRFDAADLDLAQEIGRRAGIAVDNARLYEEARSARVAREQMLAIVSHDLRNPLASIVGTIGLLQATDRVDLIHRHAEIIARAARRMDRLTGDLLDIAQLQAGRLRVEREPCDSATLINETMETVRPIAEERGIRLEVRSSDDLAVSCDRGRVLQILSNLVGNAVKFTPKGGSVVVTVSRQDQEARFAVVDTGPGIPESELSQIWEPFWQARTRARQGVGLGLFIAKTLVEAHGGRIWAESVVGIGTAFCFTLPLADLHRPPAPEEPTPRPPEEAAAHPH